MDFTAVIFHAESPPPKKFRVQASGKVIASIFWDAEGILFIDFLPKGRTINSEYYCNLLEQLREAIDNKRPGKIERGVIFHQDNNTHCHTARASLQKIHDCSFELLPHPPYSSDLAPSDFHLSPALKGHLKGKHFKTDDAVIAAVQEWCDDQDKSFFHQGFSNLEHRCNKCIRLTGDYVKRCSRFIRLGQLLHR